MLGFLFIFAKIIFMEAFIQRIVTEKQNLDENISKLSLFIESDKFDSVAERQKELLVEQIGYMKDYSKVLDVRLKDLTK